MLQQRCCKDMCDSQLFCHSHKHGSTPAALNKCLQVQPGNASKHVKIERNIYHGCVSLALSFSFSLFVSFSGLSFSCNHISMSLWSLFLLQQFISTSLFHATQSQEPCNSNNLMTTSSNQCAQHSTCTPHNWECQSHLQALELPP